jgi:hypothetical protein
MSQDHKRVLSQMRDGTKLDLERFLESVSLKTKRLKEFSNRLLSHNPDLGQLATKAAREYLDDLLTIEPDENSRQTAYEPGLEVNDVLFANQLSIAVLFGYSHYLHWVGFNIREPTRFEEVAESLSFARKAVALIGFRLALEPQLNRKQCISQRHIETSFGIGIALGYLTAVAHERGVEAALSTLLRGISS